jgi:uncharacterized protein (TIGR02466 family)
MPSKTELVFPSFIRRGTLKGAARLNRELAAEIAALEKIDDHGRRWSRDHYENGYSSYSSMTRLNQTSPTFAELEKNLETEVKSFVKALNWDLTGRKLAMTTCWANSMGPGTHHTMHNHPMCVLSGVYYVNLPPGSSPFKIEDPRMGLLMAAPPRKASAPANQQNYLKIQPKAGDFILFESWMRHEVPPHRGKQRRLSVSFNYELI